jgi:hypothetical protein
MDGVRGSYDDSWNRAALNPQAEFCRPVKSVQGLGVLSLNEARSVRP